MTHNAIGHCYMETITDAAVNTSNMMHESFSAMPTKIVEQQSSLNHVHSHLGRTFFALTLPRFSNYWN